MNISIVKIDQVDINKTFQKPTEYLFFSNVHGIFFRIDHKTNENDNTIYDSTCLPLEIINKESKAFALYSHVARCWERAKAELYGTKCTIAAERKEAGLTSCPCRIAGASPGLSKSYLNVN